MGRSGSANVQKIVTKFSENLPRIVESRADVVKTWFIHCSVTVQTWFRHCFQTQFKHSSDTEHTQFKHG